MVTIFDVAKAAGVSKSTASRAISGQGYVSQASKSKVLTAAAKLGYTPSILARQFRGQSTKNIGFIARTYYPAVGELLKYCTNILKKYGYGVTIYFTKDKAEEANILESFRLHALDGLFFVANRNNWSYIDRYTEYGPIVTWRRTDNQKVYSSYIDHYPLYKQILDYIYTEYGEINIGHVLNDPAKNNTKARLRAISEYTKLHPNSDNSWIVYYPEQENAGQQAALNYLTTKQTIDAVIVYSDYVAAEFMSTLRVNGINIPEELKLFGFDNSDFGKFMNISTIDTYLAIQAKNLTNRIICTLEHETFKEITIVPKVVIRQTC